MPSLLLEEGSTTISQESRVSINTTFETPTIKIMIANHKKLKTHKGYEWYFAEDFDKDIV